VVVIGVRVELAHHLFVPGSKVLAVDRRAHGAPSLGSPSHAVEGSSRWQ
jgi:hypothetical protein